MARRSKRKTAAQAGAAWVAAMQGGGAMTAYANGTANKGSVAMQGAAAAVESGKFLQGVQTAVSNGSMVAALNDPMSAALYNQNTGQKGAAALGQGAAKKLPKYVAAIQGLQPVYDAMRTAADAVDATRSRATAAARMTAALAVLMAAGKKGNA